MRPVDYLIIGGAMANTFLCAHGFEIGISLTEKTMLKTAEMITQKLSLRNVN